MARDTAGCRPGAASLVVYCHDRDSPGGGGRRADPRDTPISQVCHQPITVQAEDSVLFDTMLWHVRVTISITLASDPAQKHCLINLTDIIRV